MKRLCGPSGDAPRHKRNAFDVLMPSRADSRFSEELWLVARRGYLEWGWGTFKESKDIRVTQTWQCNVSVKTNEMKVWTNIPSAAVPLKVVNETSFNAAHLMSFLQKNVRRGYCEAAVRCAAELMSKSFNQFARRLCIIMVEDVILHPALPLIVWCMVATSKGFVPSPLLVAACLGVVHEISACATKDYWPYDTLEWKRPPRGLYRDMGATPESTLLRCLMLRISFGGTPSDMNVVDQTLSGWCDRFGEKRCLPEPMVTDSSGVIPFGYMTDPPAVFGNGKCISMLQQHFTGCGIPSVLLRRVMYAFNARMLRLDDVPPSGVDYHITEVVATIVHRHPEYTIEEVKLAMWQCSSGINWRRLHARNDSAMEIWDAIEDTAGEYSMRFIAARIGAK
ncbi:hypothetical protein JKP88DRAFT_255404 [Tribonema minus]|uniref:Uncharacterized protein n=1 Tax=Tribonema minus TaxID=303371 RepID=A0A835Z044_9STRA|nr:hypothetical protein JKP88DRAFT_255404 [Tribonema minus]